MRSVVAEYRIGLRMIGALKLEHCKMLRRAMEKNRKPGALMYQAPILILNIVASHSYIFEIFNQQGERRQQPESHRRRLYQPEQQG